MGQQQLILLVLATVIVGLAVVVGIRAFVENSAKANADALVQDLVRMSNDAQAWKKKPAPFGGQPAGTEAEITVKNTPSDFTGLSTAEGLRLLGYRTLEGGGYTNINGDFAITTEGGGNGVVFSAQNCTEGNRVSILVAGMTDADIFSSVETGVECDPGSAVVAADPAPTAPEG